MLSGVIIADRPLDINLLLSENAKGKIIDLYIETMTSICDEIIIVCPNPMQIVGHVPSNVRLITAYYKNASPLGSIHAALSLSKKPYVWLVRASQSEPSCVIALNKLQKLQEKQVTPSINKISFPIVWPVTLKHTLENHLKKYQRYIQ
ncbi:hypothetical protein LC087_12960 [Bacillus carboniphilus]|uniref:MobA-like NTP transferase domain-containing protein n=1 Tax=Bacillus carboniphilus TaxID=86663 RepID=A0ABY9JTK3_9BACI|nr:hypothetical protein [Bacillus carboniphilus]WLR41760.1 hypothetical protein LC087_12960 [Bacillus carboniphilus]